MRSAVLFAISVFVAGTACAAEWSAIRAEGLGAFSRQEYEKASLLLRQSWEAAATPAERATSANDTGVTLHAIRRDDEARVWLERAIHAWPDEPANAVRIVESTQSLAVVCRMLGDFPAAERLLRAALGKPLPDTELQAGLLNELGDILHETSRGAESRQLFETSAHLGGTSWKSLFDSTSGLAMLDRDARLWQRSADGWNKAVTIAREQHWPFAEAAALRGLAETWLEQGNIVRAEPLLRRALSIYEQDGSPKQQLAATLGNLAQVYLSGNKPALAEEALQRAIALDEKALGPTHPELSVLYQIRGDAAARRGQLDIARTHFERARTIVAARFGEQSPATAAVDAGWAFVEQRANRTADAAADYRKALNALKASEPDVQLLRLSVMERYADALQASHRKREAGAVRSEMKALLGP